MKVRKLDRTAKGRRRIEWVLDYYEGPRRVRQWHRSKAAAEAAADQIKHQHRQAGQAWIDLSPEERNDLMALVGEAKRENVTLRAVWQSHRDGKLNAVPQNRKTLRQALSETVTAKEGENLRPRYLVELENYLEKFIAGREEQFIDRITVAEIEKWFDGRGEALSTRRSNLGRLSAMFDVCWRRNYIPENPCLKVTVPKLDQKPPAILTPEEADKLLSVCRSSYPKMLPWLALGLFAGVRPEEVEKLTWGDVDMTQGQVKVAAETSKTRTRRIVPLHATAMSWLKVCKPGNPSSPIAPGKTALRRWRRKLKEAAQIEWVQDILRHTAASYLMQLHQDAPRVAFWLGNSPRILLTKYNNVVTPDQCKAFWALTPRRLKKGRGR